jgi:ABC-type lipoprotein export system ATPase subunit
MTLMKTISRLCLKNVKPNVFSAEEVGESQVWLQNLCFEKGKYYLIEAQSGAGKSSLCAYIYGARNDYSGEILFDDIDSSKLMIDEWQELRREHIAYLPQELDLFPELSAIENIRLKSILTSCVSDDEIMSMLKEAGVEKRTHFPVGKMSVGQQQRVALIRALCQPFDFILLDEPVSHLDDTNNAVIAAMVMRVAESRGAAVITTSVGNHLKIKDPILIKL